MSDKKARDADNAKINKSNSRRNDKAASKGGKDADADTRKALGALGRLLGGK